MTISSARLNTTPEIPPHSNDQQRRQFLVSLFVGAGTLLGNTTSGCALRRWRRRARACREDTACSQTCPQIPRRFFVAPVVASGVASQQVSFAADLVAALNTHPNSTAILLPPNLPLLAPPDLPPGPSPELQQIVAAEGPSPGIDELLIVQITQFLPFRPMRLTATLERRSLANGLVISLQHRTWNAPIDDEPLGPSKFNRFVLNHPPPLGVVERHELSLLSPQMFQRNVAESVAVELANSPV